MSQGSFIEDSLKLNTLLTDTLQGVLVGIGGRGAGLVFRALGVVRGDELFIKKQNYVCFCLKTSIIRSLNIVTLIVEDLKK